MAEENQGEETLLLKQIHEISRNILEDLMQVDDKLAKVINNLKLENEINKDELLSSLESIRKIIGTMEREDVEEMKDEEIIESINKKLRDIIDRALG